MYIDLHCHPAMKPLGKSFKNDATRYENSPIRSKKNSIWYMDKPSSFDKNLNRAITLTKFTQSDFTTLAKGNVKVISASLYPIEKSFVNTRIGDGLLPDGIIGFVTSLTKNRIDYIDNMPDYFSDLEKERDFYAQLHNKEFILDEGKFKYRLVNNFDELESNVERTDENVISVFFSIEGGHVFNCGLDPKKDTAKKAEVLANVDKVKAWDYKPLFITISHHFYNELCGHAKSLSGIAALLLNQKRNMNTGLTNLGKDVIERLLDNTNNNRIYIDVKHMSEKGRQEYYDLLDSKYQNENIPILVSHGAMNGLISYKNNRYGNYSTSRKFMTGAINFYDDELIRIAESGGVLALQMDERRVASKGELKATKKKERENDRKYYRSKLLWNQIQHGGEVLNDAGLDAWKTLAIGTDNDGIIDPINEFWTAKELDMLRVHLEEHANTYMNNEGGNLLPRNQMNPDEIIERVMFGNAYDFLSRYFI